MAEKFTLLELHLHSDDNEFRSDVQLSSDLGSFLQERFGSSSLVGATDGGDAVEIGAEEESSEDDSDTDSAVVEIDTDAHEATEEETADEDATAEDTTDEGSSGGGLGRKLLTVALLAAVVFVVRQYLSDDEFEEFDDEFEEFGDPDDEFGSNDENDL